MKRLTKTLTDLFRKNLNKEKLEVKVENLKNESVACNDDAFRRKPSYAGYDEDVQYVRNGSVNVWWSGNTGTECESSSGKISGRKYRNLNTAAVICEQLYDLAMLSHKQLSPDEMTKFVQRSNEILMLLTK